MTGPALLLAWLAFGQPPDVRVQRPGELALWSLDWRAPATCPTREAAVEIVGAYAPGLDAPVAAGARARHHLAVELWEDDEARWWARLELGGPLAGPPRELSASSCAELAHAAALIAAVTLEPVLVATTLGAAAPDPTPTPEPGAPAPDSGGAELSTAGSEARELATLESTMREPSATAPEPPVRVGAGPRTPPDTRRRPRVGIGVFGGGGYGPTQTGWPTIGGSLALFSGLWRVELRGGWWTPQLRPLANEASVPSEPPGTGAGRFRGWWLGARGCVVPRAGAVEFPICPGVELGEVLVNGITPTANPELQRKLWGAGSLGLGLRWAFIERLALTVDASVLAPFGRGDFVIDGQAAQSLARVGVRALVGFELRL